MYLLRYCKVVPLFVRGCKRGVGRVCESWGLCGVRVCCVWMWCGGWWVGRVCIRPFEAVEVMWKLLGNRDGGGVYWERLWRNFGPEVAEWAEFLCDVELGSVSVPSFS